MDLQVFAPPALANEAKRFLAPFEVNSIVSSMRALQDGPLRGDRFLLYLSGREDEEQLTKPLKSFARAKRRVQTVVLYARRADHRILVRAHRPELGGGSHISADGEASPRSC
jgi:hypothetical protein